MMFGNMSFDQILGVHECRIGNKTAAAQRSLCLCQELHVQPKLSQISIGIFRGRERGVAVNFWWTQNLLIIYLLLNKPDMCRFFVEFLSCM